MGRRRCWNWLVALALLVGSFGVAVPPPAAAQSSFTININTLTDEWSTDPATKASSKCSLREALQATVSGNPLGNQGCGAPSIANFSAYSFQMMGGTYLLTRDEELPNISKKIVIDGNNAVTINGGGQNNRPHGIFIIVSGGELLLSKLKLQYGWRGFGGAIWVKAGFVRATEVEFYRNLANNGSNGDGGAVAVDTGEFVCVKSKFIENTARQSGGAISSGGVSVLIDRCEFIRNHAELNGGAYAGFGGSEVTHPIIRDAIFRENWVYQLNVPATWPAEYAYTDDQSGGGAIYNKGYMELERVQFIKNYTDRSKGGGAIYNQGELRLLDVAITDSKAKPGGPVPATIGGAMLNDSLMIARRISIHGNEASRGGGIMNRQGGSLYLVNSTVAENLATSGGGLSNGFEFPHNGGTLSNPGGDVYIYHSTLVRANDSSADPVAIQNIGNGSIYMANSLTDSLCTGRVESHGGNTFRQFCQRFSTDNNVDLTLTDLIVEGVGELGLQGLANNGGANLSEAEFLSVKTDLTSPVVDLARDEWCIDPELVPLFLLDKDQIQAERLQGPKCDTGAIEMGTLPPQWASDKPEGAGFNFPITIFGTKWTSEQTLQIRNDGGGVINWELELANSAGGVFRGLNTPTAGALAKGQSQVLTFECAPNTLGWHDGLLRFTTDLPGSEELLYPISCAMRNNPNDPLAWRTSPPGPLSGGTVPPGSQSQVKVNIGNQGANPLAMTLNWQDIAGDTLQFATNVLPVAASAASLNSAASLASEVSIPPGSEVEITLTCAPTSPGLFSNVLEVATNDPIAPLWRYPFACEGGPAPDPEPLAEIALNSTLPSQQFMGLAISPDERQVLIGSWDNEQVRIYNVNNSATGGLSFQRVFTETGMGRITGIRYSSDGRFVYYSSASGNGVVVATRDVSGSGELSFTQKLTTDSTRLCGVPLQLCPLNSMGGARALDISPDDQNLYVSGINDNTLSILRRNPETGRVSRSQVFTSTVAGIENLISGPFGVIVSEDGQNVYLANRDSDTLIAFSRSSDGRLRYLSHYRDGENGVEGLNGATEIAISPDGRFLYVAAQVEGAIQIFARNPSDGFLTPLSVVPVGLTPYHVQISHDPEGARLLVALWGGDQILAFRRDVASGELTPLESQGEVSINGPVFMVSTRDDRHVYATLFEGGGVQQLRSLPYAPIVQNIAPAQLPTGSPTTTLTINGSRFSAQSRVYWNDEALDTTYLSDFRLTAEIPSELLAASGSVSVTVRSSALVGLTSNSFALALVSPEAPPLPAIGAVVPTELVLGSDPITVTINGSGFVASSQARLNGLELPTVYLNGETLQALIDPQQFGNPGPLAFDVVNPASGAALAEALRATPIRMASVASDAAAQPAVTQAQPASLVAGSGEQWVTLFGHNFVRSGDGSVVWWDGSPRETVVLDSNQLQFRLSAEDVAAAGSASYAVSNRGAPPSGIQAVTIRDAAAAPVAQIGALAISIGPQPLLILSGSDFAEGAEVRINGALRSATLINPFVLEVALEFADLRQGGTVVVQNSGAAPSAALVLAPQPSVYIPLMRQ